MKSNIIKWILFLLIGAGIYYLLEKFPDQTVFILGILLIIITAIWWLQIEQGN